MQQEDVRIFVGNLGTNVVQADVVEFLGLDQWASLKLHVKGKKNFGYVSLKREQAPDVLRKNGKELYGRKISVHLSDPQGEIMASTGSTPSAPSTSASNTTEYAITPFGDALTPDNKIVAMDPTAPKKDQPVAGSSPEEGGSNASLPEPEMSKTFFLQLSSATRPHRLPTLPEVALIGQEYFQQEGMKMIPIYTNGEICYKYELRESVPAHGHTVNVLGQAVPLPTWEKKSSRARQQGTLLTFRWAGTSDIEFIPSGVFDAAIEHLKLALIVPTMMQKYKGTRVKNGNRMCVVETPDNLKRIPNSIPVIDPNTRKQHQVNVSFYGQERFCSRCDDMHAGKCPYIEERKRLEVEREKLNIKTKLYSDSTLRRADVLGLRSEVLCMSGGGLGQVVQAAIDDPDPCENVVILGGTNDRKIQNFPSTDAFAHNIDMALVKLAKYAKDNEEKRFCVVQQAPVMEEETTHADQMVRELYLGRRIHKLAETHANISTLVVEYEADETGHPTLKGTDEILVQLGTHLTDGDPLIWNRAHITSDKPYSRVQAVFRYGCSGCQNFGAGLVKATHQNPLICDVCLSSPPTTKPEELLKKLAKKVEKRAEEARIAEEKERPAKRTPSNPEGMDTQ